MLCLHAQRMIPQAWGWPVSSCSCPAPLLAQQPWDFCVPKEPCGEAQPRPQQTDTGGTAMRGRDLLSPTEGSWWPRTATGPWQDPGVMPLPPGHSLQPLVPPGCRARNQYHRESEYFCFSVINFRPNRPARNGDTVLSQLLFELLMLGGLLLGNDATETPWALLSARADYGRFGSDKRALSVPTAFRPPAAAQPQIPWQVTTSPAAAHLQVTAPRGGHPLRSPLSPTGSQPSLFSSWKASSCPESSTLPGLGATAGLNGAGHSPGLRRSNWATRTQNPAGSGAAQEHTSCPVEKREFMGLGNIKLPRGKQNPSREYNRQGECWQRTQSLFFFSFKLALSPPASSLQAVPEW